MSVYLVKGKGYRYDFTLKNVRYTQAGFKMKREARKAEAEKRKEVLAPKPKTAIPTDMGFLDLVNKRLDHVKAYNTAQHYAEHRSRAKRWIVQWGHLRCEEVTQDMIQEFVLIRCKVSAHTANKEIACLRALFNFGLLRKWITKNPTEGIEFLPHDKKKRYVPRSEHIDLVMAIADQDTRDYLLTMRDTLARSVEVNRLTWDDVDFTQKYVVLHTRKKKGGSLTPRKIPMTQRLFDRLSRRYRERDPGKPWVFWHRYTSSKTGEKCEGPYRERKRFMKTLCKRAGVPYFRFHPLRHSGASLLDDNNVPIRDIQKILGHEHRETTEIYLHRISESERDAIAVLEQVSQKSHTVGREVAG